MLSSVMRHKLSLGALATLTAVLCMPAISFAKVKAADIFGSHMVLQQQMEVPVWGTADAGEEVSVSFDGQSVKTKADAQGKWMLRLAPLKATANQTGQKLIVRGSDASDITTFEDVLIGEVWLCSGQSNMQWPVSKFPKADEVAAEANYPHLRMITVKTDLTAREPRSTFTGQWFVCEPSVIKSFPATPYHFGRSLHRDIGIPVGLINSTEGNTPAQAWTSHEALHVAAPELDQEYVEQVNPGKQLDIDLGKYATFDVDHIQYLKELEAVLADQANTARHIAPDLDDSDWTRVSLPKERVSSGLHYYVGMIWYRKTIDIPEDWAGKPVKLGLGVMAGIDQTWFNGKKVGGMGNVNPLDNSGRDVMRTYEVPGELVKAGKNKIVVQMIQLDDWGRSFARTTNGMLLELAQGGQKPISTAGDWRFKFGPEVPKTMRHPYTVTRPAILYNAMIAPLIPYAVRGAAWYQGEWNTRNPVQYRRLLPALVTDWRRRWGQDKFHFIVVQLPNLFERGSTPGDRSWTILRDAQARTAQALSDTHLAVIIDIGDAQTIHPPNKPEVGRRLSLIAQDKAMGRDVVSSGPTYKSHEVQGSQVIVHFENLHGGLVLKGDKVDGFGLAGADGKFVWADAVIQGDSVVVSSDKIPSPVFVNYGWDSNPPSTLFNPAGLPAAPFTTKPQ